MTAKLALPPDALDRLLADLGREYKAQIALVRRVQKALEGVEDISGRVAELKDRVQELVDAAVDDDDNEVINPEIQDAVEWLSNNDLPEDTSTLEEVSEACSAHLEQLEELQSQLAEIVAQTPKRAFYVNREEGEED